MNCWVDTRGESAQWIGWCKRCHAVIVFGSWYGHATLIYNGRGDTTLELKPCRTPTRSPGGHGNIEEDECGGTILELPDQAVMLATFMVGGPDAVDALLTPPVLASLRPPRLW